MSTIHKSRGGLSNDLRTLNFGQALLFQPVCEIIAKVEYESVLAALRKLSARCPSFAASR
jgi:hypothetical protein